MATYETDFYAWTQQQVSLLKEGKVDQIDIDNLIEEIQSMGKSEKKELKSRLVLLIKHLLKWNYQPAKRSPSWIVSIKNQRDEITDLLKENPSFKNLLEETIAKAYIIAHREAVVETGIRNIPKSCPYNFKEIMNFQLLYD